MLFEKFRLAFLLIAFEIGVDGANILALLTAASKSHHIMETTILEELAKRGHNLTVLSTLPVPQKTLPLNYHHIYIDVTDVEDWKNYRKAALHNGTKSGDTMDLKSFFNAIDLVYRRSEQVLTHATVQNLMKSNQRFDLFFLGYNINDMMLGLAGHFRVPTVIFSTIPPMKGLRDLIGNPTAVASAPLFKETSTNVNYGFRDRFLQFIGYTIEFVLTNYVHQFYFETFYDQHFPASKNFPTFDAVRQNVSLIMTNTHFSEGNIRPALPNLIEVGGVQINETPNPLPKNLQEIIAASNDDGIIVFSLGSNVRTSDMTKETLQIFFDVFSKLKQKIIWKWESLEIPVEKPNNVYMMRWLPQIDLLAQPQVRFFISHCGAGGVFEAKYFGVPILGMPIYGDQLAHSRYIEDQGWAITLNIDYLNRTILETSIHKLLTNPSYKAVAQKMSQTFRDRPMKPLASAIYWIEYVIRYDGAKHMQSPAVHLNVLQKSSIDVILVLIIIVYICIKIIIYGLKIVLRYRWLQFILISIIVYYVLPLDRFSVFVKSKYFQ